MGEGVKDGTGRTERWSYTCLALQLPDKSSNDMETELEMETADVETNGGREQEDISRQANEHTAQRIRQTPGSEPARRTYYHLFCCLTSSRTASASAILQHGTARQGTGRPVRDRGRTQAAWSENTGKMVRENGAVSQKEAAACVKKKQTRS